MPGWGKKRREKVRVTVGEKRASDADVLPLYDRQLGEHHFEWKDKIFLPKRQSLIVVVCQGKNHFNLTLIDCFTAMSCRISLFSIHYLLPFLLLFTAVVLRDPIFLSVSCSPLLPLLCIISLSHFSLLFSQPLSAPFFQRHHFALWTRIISITIYACNIPKSIIVLTLLLPDCCSNPSLYRCSLRTTLNTINNPFA